MDNYIPCLKGRPCFSTANGNELWVIIMEKAWAKMHGNYERIEAGLCCNAMRDLTGAPSMSYLTASTEGLPDMLVDWD